MNIKNILLFYKKKYGLNINDAVLEAFVQYLAERTQTRPIPDFKDIDVIASAKAAGIFKTLLEKLQAAQKDSQENLASLEKLTAKILMGLDKENFEEAKNLLKNSQDFIRLIGYSGKLKLNRCESPEELLNFLKLVKEKALSINYSNVLDKNAKNDLTKFSLEIHSKICKQSLESSSGPAKFIHFYEKESGANKGFRGNPRAAEYLCVYDSEDEDSKKTDFNKTSHGIGSGIYGVAHLSTEIITQQVDERQSQFCIIEITQPLRLSQEEAGKYTEISKHLQEIGNFVKTRQLEARRKEIKLTRKEALDIVVARDKARLMEFATAINSFESIKSRSFSDKEIYDFLYSSLGDFLEAARSKGNAENIVPMPINYLVDNLGFTGVVSQANDMFNRGLIAMHFSDNPELKTFAKIPVKSLSQDEYSSPHAEDFEDVLTSSAPLPTGVTMGGPYPFFSPQSQTPSVNDDIAAQENTSDKSKNLS